MSYFQDAPISDSIDHPGTPEPPQPVLHDSVLRLLPTLDALLFAIDTVELGEMESDDGGGGGREDKIALLRSELAIMLEGLRAAGDRLTPILVLSCQRGGGGGGRVAIRRLAGDLGLLAEREKEEEQPRRPWAIYEVNIHDMDGMGMALDWALYHCQKRKNSLEYHKNNSASGRM